MKKIHFSTISPIATMRVLPVLLFLIASGKPHIFFLLSHFVSLASGKSPEKQIKTHLKKPCHHATIKTSPDLLLMSFTPCPVDHFFLLQMGRIYRIMMYHFSSAVKLDNFSGCLNKASSHATHLPFHIVPIIDF